MRINTAKKGKNRVTLTRNEKVVLSRAQAILNELQTVGDSTSGRHAADANDELVELMRYLDVPFADDDEDDSAERGDGSNDSVGMIDEKQFGRSYKPADDPLPAGERSFRRSNETSSRFELRDEAA